MDLKSRIYHILIWCSGADPGVLYLAPNSERIKHCSIGILVLIPSIVGLFTMTYAVSTLTQFAYIYLTIGVIWSLIVLSVDRFIVSTMNPLLLSKNKYYGVFAVRFLYAVFIGLIIGHPTVLLVFESDIMQKSHEKREEYYKKNTSYIDTIKNKYDYKDSIANLEYTRKLKYLENGIIAYNELSSAEISGLKIDRQPYGSTTGRYGRKDAADFMIAQRDTFLILKKVLTAEHNRDSTKLAEMEALEINSVLKKAALLDSSFSESYLARYKLFNQIKNSEESGEATLMYSVIIFFFIILDTIAVLFKFLMPPGFYEHIAAYEVNYGFLPPLIYLNKEDQDLEKYKIAVIKSFIIDKYNELKSSLTILDFTKNINELEELRKSYFDKYSAYTDATYRMFVNILNTKISSDEQNKDVDGSLSYVITYILLIFFQILTILFVDIDQKIFAIIYLIVDTVYFVFQEQIKNAFTKIYNRVNK